MPKISAYTFFTDSHKSLLEYFLSTFQYEADFDLKIRYANQVTVDGTSHNWKSTNFFITVRQKLNYLNEIADSLQDGDMFIFLDCDIICLHPIRDFFIEQLGDADIAFQNDGAEFCTGCFICRVSDKIRRLFKEAITEQYSSMDDQAVINAMLHEPQYANITTAILSKRACNYNKLIDGVYDPSKADSFPVAELKSINPVLYHTNYTIGVYNKLHMTRLVLKHLMGDVV